MDSQKQFTKLTTHLEREATAFQVETGYMGQQVCIADLQGQREDGQFQ